MYLPKVKRTADFTRSFSSPIAVRTCEAFTARRGSFPFLPRLGSRMGELRREKPSGWDALARQFAVEALDDLEDVTVTGASVRRDRDALLVTADLLWQGEALSVTARWEE